MATTCLSFLSFCCCPGALFQLLCSRFNGRVLRGQASTVLAQPVRTSWGRSLLAVPFRRPTPTNLCCLEHRCLSDKCRLIHNDTHALQDRTDILGGLPTKPSTSHGCPSALPDAAASRISFSISGQSGLSPDARPVCSAILQPCTHANLEGRRPGP